MRKKKNRKYSKIMQRLYISVISNKKKTTTHKATPGKGEIRRWTKMKT